MKTVLYNTEKQTSKRYANGYTVDGILQPLGQLAESIWHLKLIENERPEITETQKLTMKWLVDFENDRYTQIWEVEDNTPYEIAMQSWAHPQYLKKINAPKQLVLDDTGIKMLGWFQINNFPYESIGDRVELYCNTILPEHEPIIEMYGDLVTVQDRPEP